MSHIAPNKSHSAIFSSQFPDYVCIIKQNIHNLEKSITMETAINKSITVQSTVNAPVEKVWKYWSEPAHIMQWCQASDDWHAPRAENDLKTGGKFSTTMAAKDGSFSFDFGGVYDEVVEHKLIKYTMGDGRKVSVAFNAQGNATEVIETFEPENTNPEEMQRGGWQAILDNFKKYTEEN
jgi:uncharacterized protein YndB with AHSA1/START domain